MTGAGDGFVQRDEFSDSEGTARRPVGRGVMADADGRRFDAAGRLAYAGYDAAGALAAVLSVAALPYVVWRGFGDGLAQRLGVLPGPMRGLAEPPVWIHAASVGETLAAAPLVARLRERCAGVPVVTSSTTVSGRETSRRELQPDAATLLPMDALFIVDRAMRAVRPRCLVLVETEIWPGLLRAASRVGTPVVMVSGRLSEPALRRSLRVAPLFRAALSCVVRFGMQTVADAERIVRLGANPDRVEVTGSIKGGRVPSVAQPAVPLLGLAGRPVLIAASTQPGEEEFVLEACAGLWQRVPNLLLMLAPRRSDRFDSVAALLGRNGLNYERRTAAGQAIPAEARVLLIDTVGELANFFPLATAVFVGGTVADLGGHNVLEPAAYGKPVAFGPHTENVSEAAEDLCRSGGGRVVCRTGELGSLWQHLLEDAGEAERMGERAREVTASRAAAVERTWTLLAPHLKCD